MESEVLRITCVIWVYRPNSIRNMCCDLLFGCQSVKNVSYTHVQLSSNCNRSAHKHAPSLFSTVFASTQCRSFVVLCFWHAFWSLPAPALGVLINQCAPPWPHSLSQCLTITWRILPLCSRRMGTHLWLRKTVTSRVSRQEANANQL